MKSDHQQRVEQFMELAGQEIPATPVMPSSPTRRLRANIIFEETLETLEGLGFVPRWDAARQEWVMEETCKPDLVLSVDGCCDLRVVTTGTLSAMGVADEIVQIEVDKNNLAKFGPGGYRRESDGKWMKPPGHQPPDILGVLLKLGYRV